MAKELIRFDWALKRLLRDKANFEVLEGFLAELLKIDLTIQNIGESEGNQADEKDKFNRVDILAHTSDGEIVIVELQIDSEVDYFHRMLYGVSKAIIDHIKLGVAYEFVKKVYSINIVYFELGQGSDYVYFGKTEFVGIHHHDILSLSAKQKSKFELEHVSEIYPEYYILKINKFNDIAKDGLDEWIYFLKNNEIKDNFNAKGLNLAKETLDFNKMSDAEKAAYKHHLENKMLSASLIEGAKFEGMFEGEIKGRNEGRIEGISIGEERKTLEIVEKAINNGLDNETIAVITSLSIIEIEEIRKNIK